MFFKKKTTASPSGGGNATNGGNSHKAAGSITPSRKEVREMVNARLVARMNVILEQCGLSFSHPSTQIYSKPQRVHAIAPADLGFIATNAHLLVARKDIICDFEALSTVLWGMMTEVESVVDKLVGLSYGKQKRVMAEKSANVTKTNDAIPQLKEQQEMNSNNKQAKEIQAPEGNMKTMNNNNPEGENMQKLYNTLQSVLVQTLRVLLILRALESVDALDEVHSKLHPLQSNVEILVRLTYQLIKLFNSIASTLLGKDKYNTNTDINTDSNNNDNHKVKTLSSSNAAYSRTAHDRLQLLESAINSLLQFTGLLTSRPTLDVSATLHLLSSQEVWEMTGCGFVALNGYCNAVEVCIKTLYAHRAEYDNVNEIVAELVWTRLAQRPAFHAQLFELLWFKTSEWNAMNYFSHSSNINNKVTSLHKDVLLFGLLMHTRRVQRAIEELIDFSANVSSSPSSAVISAEHSLLSFSSPYLQAASLHYLTSREMRKACLTYLRTLENSPQKSLLSYSQLLLLAAIDGMPWVDLTNDEALHTRARNTMLVCAEDVPLLDAEMLRLLMACCYTVYYTFNTNKVNEEAAEEAEAAAEEEANGHNAFKSFHSTLSAPSVLLLYDAMAHYLFQVDKLKCMTSYGTTRASYPTSKPSLDDSTLRGFLSSGQLRINSLMRLLLVNAIRNSSSYKKDENSEHANAPLNANSTMNTQEQQTLSPQESDIDTKNEVSTKVTEESFNRQCESSSQLLPSQNNACTHLLTRVMDVLRILFDANNAAEEQRVKHDNTNIKNNNTSSNDNNTKNGKEMQVVAVKENEDRVSTLRTITRMMATSHFMLCHSNEFIKCVNRRHALECMVRIFALRTYYSASPQTPLREQVLDKVVGRLMRQQLTLIVLQMTPVEINHLVTRTLSSMCNASVARYHSLLELRMMEAYLRALSTSSAAFVMEDATLLNHYMNIFLYCTTAESALTTLTDRISKNRIAYAQSHHVNLFNDLVMAAHDFVVATFWARKPLSILFVPTYVSVFVPSPNKPAKYGLPSLPVIKHFASRVRAACQGMEMCAPFSDEQWGKLSDGTVKNLKNINMNGSLNSIEDKQLLATTATTTLERNANSTLESKDNNKNAIVNYDNSINNTTLTNLTEAQREAIMEITPSNATMLVVAALFDKLCDLWSKQSTQDNNSNSNSNTNKSTNGSNANIVDSTIINEFTAYFSALVNLLQCKDNAVLQRVCASVEAIEVEHLRGSGNAQLQFLKYIESTVDNIRGTTKKSIAEWLLKVSAKVMQENRATSKL